MTFKFSVSLVAGLLKYVKSVVKPSACSYKAVYVAVMTAYEAKVKLLSVFGSVCYEI